MDEQITIGLGEETLEFYVHPSESLEVTVGGDVILIDRENAFKLSQFLNKHYPTGEVWSEEEKKFIKPE